MSVFNKVKNFVLNRQGLKKISSLYKIASIGLEFCESPMFKNRALHILSNVYIDNRTGDPKKLRIGNYCNISCRIVLHSEAELIVGDYVYMNSNCSLNVFNTVTIGSNCLFGPNVVIWDSDNHPLDSKLRLEQSIEIPKVASLKSHGLGGGDVVIGDNVWIGMDCLILGGVKIGEGAVIAASSVVVKDIPPYVLAAGVPAKVVKQLR